MRLHRSLPDRLLGIAASAAAMLGALGRWAASRALRSAAQLQARRAQRNGVVEVHLADGQIAFVEVPRRRQVGGVRGLLLRAWSSMTGWAARQWPRPGAPGQPRLALRPVPVRSEALGLRRGR